MTPADYEAAVALWRATEGLVLRDVDRPEAIASYLERNPGSSFVAIDGERLVGTVLCGHDGRRGYLQHLVVAPPYRRQGIARMLVERALGALREAGILKCHLMVLPGNTAARNFWAAIGWAERQDVVLMSHVPADAPDA
ncbi:MAG TPA: GNAT family N-acetyltransferase [Gemmatimonadaceae bacterium]